MPSTTRSPSIVSGQSNAPAFRAMGDGAYDNRFVASAGPRVGKNNPDFNLPDPIIEKRIGELRAMPTDVFPTDLPKYHFTIIQNNWHYPSTGNMTVGRLTATRMYKLPFPRELIDKHEVNYNTNFNYLNALTLGLAGRFSQVASAASGLTINNFKAVVLEVPDFKTHQLSWVFSPKNSAESKILQGILFRLKRDMSPEGKWGTNNGLVLQFPKIFTLYFSPNSEWLFKFKPCVLSSVAIDFTGGAGVPAFYGENSAPESIIFSTNWIELEYWIADNFKDAETGEFGGGDYPSNDPLDGLSWHHYNSGATPGPGPFPSASDLDANNIPSYWGSRR